MKISVKSHKEITSIEADGFDNLLSVLRYYGYSLNASCDGKGTCGNCKVIVDSRVVTACKTPVRDGMTVELFQKKSSEIFSEISSEKEASAIIDIGTTTVKCALVSDGKIISLISEKNSQESFGADVISRISHGEGNDLALMNSAIISQLNSMLKRLSENIKITDISIVGNTTMLHIFLNTPCKSMGVYPYTPAFIDEKSFDNAIETGLEFSVPLYILPSISAFCGADIVADISEYYTDSEDYTLLIDFGTNAEVALFNKDNIFVTSAAAGPAFECGNISCGMPSLDGAVCSYDIINSVPVINTIHRKNPVGICASGLVDIVAQLLKNNIIDKSGFLEKDFEISKNIFITQADVREFQLAKAAVEASVKILSKKINSPIKKVCICGNLGKHLKIENAKFLRLIPDINDVVVSENAPLFSLKNSDKKLWKKIAESAQYIDISNDGDFEKIFEGSLDF